MVCTSQYSFFGGVWVLFVWFLMCVCCFQPLEIVGTVVLALLHSRLAFNREMVALPWASDSAVERSAWRLLTDSPVKGNLSFSSASSATLTNFWLLALLGINVLLCTELNYFSKLLQAKELICFCEADWLFSSHRCFIWFLQSFAPYCCFSVFYQFSASSFSVPNHSEF